MLIKHYLDNIPCIQCRSEGWANWAAAQGAKISGYGSACMQTEKSAFTKLGVECRKRHCLLTADYNVSFELTQVYNVSERSWTMADFC
jgi:hypothetical protein